MSGIAIPSAASQPNRNRKRLRDEARVPLPGILKEMLSLPTAAFVEGAVLGYIADACRALPGVRLKRDRWGNLLAHYKHQPRTRRPLVFTAHTDHPGFVALRMQRDGRLLAAFRGWVEPAYFDGTGVRFWSGGRWIRGRVVEVVKAAPIYGMIGRTGRPERVAIRVHERVEPNSPGMWDLPDPALRDDGCVHARGCDDVAGAAALLALLERLSRKRARAEVYALFTRAEEVGFVGAIAAARDGIIPKRLPVIAIENSKAIPGVEIGGGPVLRVGDKTSMFTPAITAFCDRVAKELSERQRSFKYQRKLMDGGTCESTAYIAYGYEAGGICLALGNYHNMDTQRRKIGSEFISLDDWRRMVDWFEALATDQRGYGTETSTLRATLDERFARYLPLLRAGDGGKGTKPVATSTGPRRAGTQGARDRV
jgi:endoglucanase